MIRLKVLIRDNATNVINFANINSEGFSPESVIYGSYIWTWYGFDFIVDAYNAGLVAIDLTNARDNLLAGLTVAGILGQYEVALGAGIGVVVLNGWINAAQTGQYTGNGASMSFLGTPSHCWLIGVYAL